MKIKINQKEYTVGFPNLKAMKILQPGLNILNAELFRVDQLKHLSQKEVNEAVEKHGVKVVGMAQEAVDAAAAYLFHSIKRNHPEFTLEELEENSDVPSLMKWYGMQMAMLQMPPMEDDSQPVGESTGMTSLQIPAPLQEATGNPLKTNSTSTDSSNSINHGENSLLSASA